MGIIDEHIKEEGKGTAKSLSELKYEIENELKYDNVPEGTVSFRIEPIKAKLIKDGIEDIGGQITNLEMTELVKLEVLSEDKILILYR